MIENIYNIPCIILAGGKSSRMQKEVNQDKTLMPFGEFNTIVEYQIDRLKECFDEVYISTKEKDKFEYQDILIDKYPNYSPIYAIKSIFETIVHEKQFDEVFIITADSPLISIYSINKIIDSSINYDISVAKTQFRHNLCGVYKRAVLPMIEKMIEDDIEKVGYLVQNSNSTYVKFENENEFININTFEEYQEGLGLIR